MKRSTIVLLCLTLGLYSNADEIQLPLDFTEAIVKKVSNNALVSKIVEETPTSYTRINWAFLKGVTTDDFINLALEPSKIREFFKDDTLYLDEAVIKPTSQANVFSYEFGLKYYWGYGVWIPFAAKGLNTVKRAKVATDVANVENVLTNHLDKIKVTRQFTQLVSFGQGILVREMSNIQMQKDSDYAEIILPTLKSITEKYIRAYKQSLTGSDFEK